MARRPKADAPHPLCGDPIACRMYSKIVFGDPLHACPACTEADAQAERNRVRTLEAEAVALARLHGVWPDRVEPAPRDGGEG